MNAKAIEHSFSDFNEFVQAFKQNFRYTRGSGRYYFIDI